MKAEAKTSKKTRSQEALDRFHEENKLSETYDVRNLRHLWPFIRPYRLYLVGSLMLLCVSAAFAILRPLIMRYFFQSLDVGNVNTRLQTLTWAGAGVAILLVGEQLVAFPQVYLMQIVGARSMADLRMHIFRFLHGQRLAFFDRTPIGRLVTRVTNDVDAMNEMFASGALNAFGDLIRLVAIVIIMIRIDWKMSMVAFVSLPPVTLGVMWTRKRIRDAFREVRVKTARLNAYLNEQVTGMAVVQAFAREEKSAEEFDEINDAYRVANNQSIVYDATLDAVIEMVSSICIAMVLWYIGRTTLNVKMDFGNLVAFVAYIEMFFVPIRDLSTRYTLLQSAMAGAERVFELLSNQESDEVNKNVAVELTKEDVSSDSVLAVQFNNVSFAYKKGTPVLNDVSFDVKPGEKIALVGATGAGKTTVLSLLLRLYQPSEGNIYLFGNDLQNMNRHQIRRNFSMVPQEVFLFPGTIASNIAAGDEHPDMNAVKSALVRIGALEFFEKREGGLSAKVQERGANFSAGERQLIAFARALYRDPRILVLDEATANIDSTTEAQLQKAVAGAIEGRACLMVAHRLSTIRSANRVLVFHQGRIVEQGSHDELLAHGGIYARLYELQFSREDKR